MTADDLARATEAAIARHGAVRVHDAATQAMAGHHAALARVELLRAACNLPALVLVQSRAYKAMSTAEQASDLADIAVELARLP